MDIIAKVDKYTKDIETLKEHTNLLLQELEVLKNIYKQEIDIIVSTIMNTDDFWDILYQCCFFHDFGKANIHFRKRMEEAKNGISLPLLEGEIYHNYLSVSFLPKTFRQSIREKYGKEMNEVIYQAIAYHHERDKSPADFNLSEYIEGDLQTTLDDINKHMDIHLTDLFYNYTNSIGAKNRIKSNHKYYSIYILLKGLLHRLDYAASAHKHVELMLDNEIPLSSKVDDYFKLNNWSKNDLQEFLTNTKDSNAIVIGSTGLGKTEGALYNIGDSKGFFILPLRVSINALYDRVTSEIHYTNVGLLHSTALNHLENTKINSDDVYNADDIYEESKLLSKKLTFCTADQILKFPLKFKGYEKSLATLSYSKIVIDEIQAYSPSITAIILHGIKELSEMNGKFLIMTATLPRIYTDTLKNYGVNFEFNKFVSNKRRHFINLNKHKSIVDDINNIKEKAKTSKVLVIVNTVKRAKEIYNLLSQDVDTHLLHSMFIVKDRLNLEKEIKSFTAKDNSNVGVWVVTQIVEASLDIDFDFLFTEMSTLDSLFQRLGRCFRSREYLLNVPNVYIYTNDCSGIGTIYDKDIFNKSIKYLNNYNNSLLSEEVKVDLVDRLYSKEELQGTNYLTEFENACEKLEYIQSYEHTNNEAQKIFREINSITIIPLSIYEDNMLLFEEYNDAKGEAKRHLYKQILELTVSVPRYLLDKKQSSFQEIKGVSHIYVSTFAYSNSKGLDTENLYDNCL